MNREFAGLGDKGRQLLSKLLRASKESFTVAEASQILHVSRYHAACLLGTWARTGWLHRVRRGLYIPVPLQSSSTVITPEEPWLIAHKLFSHCYIGGWTAAQHWGLTEQVFNPIFVMTTKKVHEREQKLSGVTFKIKTILPKKIFGTQTIWSGKVKIAISDPTKTVVDGLNDPAVLGGIRMVSDVLLTYVNSKDFNSEKLLKYTKTMENSVIYKRLGFLMEQLKSDTATHIIAECKKKLKSGYSQLDPAVKGDYLEVRWNLWVPKSFTVKEHE